MPIGKKTAQQVKTTNDKKPTRVGSGQLSAWSFSTSMRNPDRLAQILNVVLLDERERKKTKKPRIWNPEGQAWMFEQLKQRDHYNETKNNDKGELGNAGRGRTATSPAAQIGFIQAEPGKPLKLTELGRLYAEALEENDTILAEDYILLALTRLRLTLNEHGKPSHWAAGKDTKHPITAPLAHIIDLFLDESIYDGGGISRNRAKYIVPLAVSKQRKSTLLGLAHSKTFEKDLATVVEGKLATVNTYGDTLIRYLLLSGLFTTNSSLGKNHLTIAPGREHQARRIRDALLDLDNPPTTWEDYRREQCSAPAGTFPWHGTDEDYLSDCQEIASVILTLSGEAPVFDPDDRQAHVMLRQQLLEVQESRYITSGQSLVDFPHNIKRVRNATTPSKNSGRTITPLEFEAAVLCAATAVSNIGRYAPNYLKDSNNKPIAHAPGNDGDGWIHGKGPNGPHLMIEATMQGGRGQTAAEWQPAIRHIKNKKINHELIPRDDKAGLLIATSLHEDTIGMFGRDARTIARDEQLSHTQPYILPLTHEQYARLMENTVAQGERLATLEDLVEWIKETVTEYGNNDDILNPASFYTVIDDAIARWNDTMQARAQALINVQSATSKKMKC